MNRSDTALLLLDLQNEMVDPNGKIGSNGLAKIVEERRVIDRAAAALEAARAKSLKIAYIRLGFRADYADALSVAPRITKLKESGAAILGSWGTEFPEKLRPRSDEMIFTKQCVNPFFNTGLLSWLNKNGIKEIVIAGVATNLVVEATARYADDAGLTVTVLEDCCASPNSEWHRFSIEKMLPLFGRVTSSSEFVNSF
jgi:nicotinamidase-related amidase